MKIVKSYCIIKKIIQANGKTLNLQPDGTYE